MVYSTCTINKKENEQMIKQFLDKYPDMKIIERKEDFYRMFGFKEEGIDYEAETDPVVEIPSIKE